MRRHFSLPIEDMEWLEGRGRPFELVSDGGVLRAVVHELVVPSGYTVGTVSAYVRVEAGYPDTQLDMVYFHPALVRVTGTAIAAVSDDAFDGKSWQRWSRHRTPANPWRPGVDNLATHFALVNDWMERETRKA
jgi:E2/UBC family protein E